VVSGMLGEITPAQAAETADLLGPDPQRYRKSFRDPGELFEVVRSDWLFRMPSLHLAESQVGAGGRAYLYELTWTAPGMGGIFGACHGLDVPLVFGNLTVGQPATLIGEPTPDAVAMSEQMRIAWTAFATDGDPGWPPSNSGTTRLLDVESVNGDYPEQVSQAIWRDAPGVLDLTDALPRHGAHP
jgi:para-nitrobenzyl esterase